MVIDRRICVAGSSLLCCFVEFISIRAGLPLTFLSLQTNNSLIRKKNSELFNSIMHLS